MCFFKKKVPDTHPIVYNQYYGEEQVSDNDIYLEVSDI